MLERPVESKSKIVMKILGNPKGGAVIEPGKQHYLGRVYGKATGISERADPTGNVYKGLKGTFQGEPADITKPIIRSALIYLPRGFFEIVETQFEGDNPAAEVSFAFDVYTQPADNAAGYEYSLSHVIKPDAKDPLDDMAEQLAAVKPKQLTGPKTGEKSTS